MHTFHVIPSHRVAEWLLGAVSRVLDFLGIDHSAVSREVLYLVTVIAIAIFTGWIVQKIVVSVVGRLIGRRFPEIASELSSKHVLTRCGRVIPPLVLLSLIPFAFDADAHTMRVIVSTTAIYSIVMATIAVNSVLGFVWVHYNAHHNAKNLPLKGVVDVICGVMWGIAVIVIVSIILDKSPAGLLTGLGAFAAVLLLVFRNSILGLVAGVQLSLNDMLRVGDWISVPGTEANGIVIDVSLVVVKIRNWNNTVSMLPAYRLISDSFVNWRCMKDTGSRQIEMSVYMDVSTVRPLSDDELRDLQQRVPMLADFIDVKLKQRAAGATANVYNKEAGVDGTIDTNLGLLRAYLNIYLRQHPYINLGRMCMVRLMAPTPTGFPLQIFAYLTTADWPAYEGIMADIFEHVTAIAPTFGLSVYEQPTTRSVYSAGQTTQQGVPYYGTAPVQSPAPMPDTNKLG